MKPIGVFDSGFGGLEILQEIVKKLPEYDYVYLGDTARLPYGSRTQEVVYNFTVEAVDFLLKKSCPLLILACNTASSEALRRIQKEYLAKNFPEKKVLGVIIPAAEEAVEKTKNNTAITVSFALNYGGRDEILRAIKKVLAAGVTDGELTEERFSQFLDTAGIPDPDLIIRTGGQLRLSGYLPWQSIYAELYFTPVLFPDFSPAEFDKAIEEYQQRTRRFGGGKFKDYKKK